MIKQNYNDNVTMRKKTLKEGVLAAVDQFEIVRVLGTGGFGSVYLAKDRTSRIDVALKVVGKGLDATDEIRRNFQLIHGLTHPNIAVAYPLHEVREVGSVDDRIAKDFPIAAGDVLAVMAYAPGVTLDKWRMMFDGGRVPPRDAADIIAQIADALDCAHGQGIIHRDIKPSNVMVDTKAGGRPFVRLLDFGLATKTGVEAGEVCGTYQYMSQEQWTGGTQDAGTDQYSLAVLACELLTGHVPFESVFKCGDTDVMRIAVSTRDVDFPVGLSAKARSVLLRGLAKSSAGRYSSCAEFARELSRVCGQKKWLVYVWASFGLLAVGLAAAFLIRSSGDRNEALNVEKNDSMLPDPIIELIARSPAADTTPSATNTTSSERGRAPVAYPEGVRTPSNQDPDELGISPTNLPLKQVSWSEVHEVCDADLNTSGEVPTRDSVAFDEAARDSATERTRREALEKAEKVRQEAAKPPLPPPCPRCGNQGKVSTLVPCDRCGGKGREPCGECGSIVDSRTGAVACAHGVKCPICNGTGQRNREGFLSVFREYCSDCNGHGWLRHTKCQGSGFLSFNCTKCDGKKEISAEVDCPLCGKTNKKEKLNE